MRYLNEDEGYVMRTVLGKKFRMRVAILGSRGIPACYSGYDTLVEEISFGLAKDIDVIVYCRSSYYNEQPNMLQGVRLIYLPAPRLKAIESLLHSFLATLHVLLQNVDVIYFLDPANAPFCLILLLFGKKVVIHTDGLGWKRRKWGLMARRYYKLVEWLCAHSANSIVTDNPAMGEYYFDEYGVHSVYISYGASNKAGLDESVYDELGLSPNRYLLVVARLEPENNTDFILEEYSRASIRVPLVIVGDSPYDARYLKRLHKLSNEHVYFTGRINDQAKLNALYKGAYLYIHGHEVGGTNPSLLRAMNAGVAPLAINVSFNKAVIGNCGFVFERERGSLSSIIERLMKNVNEVESKSRMARERSDKIFKWEYVVCEHKKLFYQVIGGSSKSIQCQ